MVPSHVPFVTALLPLLNGTVCLCPLFLASCYQVYLMALLFFTGSVGLQEVQDFIGRIQFYQYLGKHKNLVQLEGCCTERLPLYMMLEDVVPGDLLNFLWTCRRVSKRDATLVRKSFDSCFTHRLTPQMSKYAAVMRVNQYITFKWYYSNVSAKQLSQSWRLWMCLTQLGECWSSVKPESGPQHRIKL